jgi:acetaldehyde dehydrogenase
MAKSPAGRLKVAIIGSGNIGTDLMIKILRTSPLLEMAALVGIEPQSEGLKRADRLGVAVTAEGLEGLRRMPAFADIDIVFDATSAASHLQHSEICIAAGKVMIDLTPAAIGPYVIPEVNGDAHLDARNVNMVTCGGQATIPIVAAVSATTPVLYAEIVASIASTSAGPGTRANIDEFTETTAKALQVVGGANRAKAIIVLNPADPPMIMRDTVHCLVGDTDLDAIGRRVIAMVDAVAAYVPGYRLKQRVQFRRLDADDPAHDLVDGRHGRPRWQVSVYLEVEGAAHYLPAYAGNLDIMTSAALRVGESMAARTEERVP